MLGQNDSQDGPCRCSDDLLDNDFDSYEPYEEDPSLKKIQPSAVEKRGKRGDGPPGKKIKKEHRKTDAKNRYWRKHRDDISW